MEAQLRVLRAEGPIVAREVMEGVTPTSNWIVPNLILIGDVPRPNDSLEMLLDYGVECFVDVRSNASGAAACKYLAACTIEPPEHITYEGFDLGSVVTNPTTQAVGAASAFFAQVLARAFDGPGRITYVHCGDGGGLSALAGGVLLSFTYNVSALKATTVISQQYACRSAPGAPGSLFSTQLKTVAREISTQLPALSSGSWQARLRLSRLQRPKRLKDNHCTASSATRHSAAATRHHPRRTQGARTRTRTASAMYTAQTMRR
jgi:hypothetical protein